MTGALGPMTQADMIGAAIAAGGAAGADVGMGAGTSWLTGLGLPATYGNDIGALFGYGADQVLNGLGGIDMSKLIGTGANLGSILGGYPTGVISAPTNIMTGSTSAPQTSAIPQGTNLTTPSTITPATMPTGSVMGAFGNKSQGDTPDYMKYFSQLF